MFLCDYGMPLFFGSSTNDKDLSDYFAMLSASDDFDPDAINVSKIKGTQNSDGAGDSVNVQGENSSDVNSIFALAKQKIVSDVRVYFPKNSNITESSMVVMYLKVFENIALFRYCKIHNVNRNYKRILNNVDYILIVTRNFCLENNIFLESKTEKELKTVLNYLKLKSIIHPVAYSKVGVLRDYLVGNVFSAGEMDNSDFRRKFGELLAAYRMYFLSKEIDTIIKQYRSNAELRASQMFRDTYNPEYFQKLGGKTRYVEMHKGSLLFYYPVFVRDALDKLMNKNGYINEISLDSVLDEVTVFFKEVSLWKTEVMTGQSITSLFDADADVDE